MSKIISIGTALPAHHHRQMDICQFMQNAYAMQEQDRRKIRFLYQHSGIGSRYSVVPDYSKPLPEWKFFPQSEGLDPFPSIEQRMMVYSKQAPLLSVDAIRDCLNHSHDHQSITHLITVSCTGMSAPGLDLQVAELMDLNKNIFRTSVNFMGCYAAIHGLKLADAFCRADKHARVLVVCTELCTLHFQRDATMDNIMASLLFGDGAAAVLVAADEASGDGLYIDGFFSEIILKGRRDMAWEISSTGFLMTLSGYIPSLLEADFPAIVDKALNANGSKSSEITDWCIHPGGRKILEAIEKSMNFKERELRYSYDVLRDYGNLSSATILFVLKNMLHEKKRNQKVFGAAFGPGLTVETFTAHG